MSIRTDTVPHPGATLIPGIRCFAPVRIFRAFFMSTARFFSSLQAAQAVVRRADYYYSRSNEELKRIGLTREEVPGALLREYERNLK